MNERLFHGMIIDIDEKKRTDAELVWRDTLADIITRNLDSVYIVMNKKNRHCVYVSPSIESIFGINKEIAKPLLEVQKLEQDTTNAFTEDVQNSLDAGMDAHISKPMDLESLKNIIWKIKREAGEK